MSDIKEAEIPHELIPNVVATCGRLIDKFGQVVADPHFSENVRSDRGEIVSFVGSGSTWHKLRVGEAVLNLQLYHWDNSEPPHSLAILKDQTGVWPVSLSIESPAILAGAISVRSAVNRSPNVGNYEIRPGSHGQGLRLISYGDMKADNLFQTTGVGGVNDLWDSLEDAIHFTEPDDESVAAHYIIQSRARPYLQHLGAIFKSQSNLIRNPSGEWQTNNYLKVVLSGVMSFIARWTDPHTASHPLQIEYRAASILPEDSPEDVVPKLRAEDLRKLAEIKPGEKWERRLHRETTKYGTQPSTKLVTRSEFTTDDLHLVEAIGHSILHYYAARYADALKP